MMLNAYGYSGRWNNRRLEHTFHGLWQLIFTALIHDLRPRLQVIPQLRLESRDGEPLPAIQADDSFSTQPGIADEKIPDFAIVMLDVIKRPDINLPQDLMTSFRHWRVFKLRCVETPLISDLKRPPPRSIRSPEEFRLLLDTFQLEAQVSLEAEATSAFAMQPGIEKLILVGSSGDWWTWRITTRSSINVIVDNDSVLSELELDSNSEGGCYPTAFPRKGKILRRGKFMESPPPTGPSVSEDESSVPFRKPVNSGKAKHTKGAHSKKSPTFYSHEDLAPPYREPELEEVNVDIVEQTRMAAWSNNILCGTRVSNQQLFVIHQLLQRWTSSETGQDFWNVSFLFIMKAPQVMGLKEAKTEDRSKHGDEGDDDMSYFNGDDLTV